MLFDIIDTQTSSGVAHHMDDSRLGRKCHLQQRQIDLIERHLVGEERLAVLSEAICFRARQVVVAKQRRRVAAVSSPALRQVVRKRLRAWEQVIRELANLAEEGELTSRMDGGVTAQYLLDQRRAGAWKAYDEDGLGNIGARLRPRQQLDVCPGEELLEPPEERLDCLRAVFQTAALCRELAFGGNEVLPCKVIPAEPVMQSPALEFARRRQADPLRR